MKILLKFIVLILLAGNISAQKKVLLEKFTNVYCGTCPNASLIIQDLVEQYPNTIWISHYKGVDWEHNHMQNDESIQLHDDLNVYGNPTAMVDRTPLSSGLIQSSTDWENQILDQQEEKYFANFEIDNYEFESRWLHFDVKTTLDELPDLERELRLIVFIVEDDVIWKQHSYYNDVEGHPLEGLGGVIASYAHQNAVRYIVEGPWGVSDAIPSDPVVGSKYTRRFSQYIPQAYNIENISIVTALTYHDYVDVENRQVLNAGRTYLRDTELFLTDTKDFEEVVNTMYPNPSRGNLQLEFKTIPDRVEFHNFQGRVVKTVVPNSQTENIDLSNFVPGKYIVKVMQGDVVATQKLVIQ